MAQDVFMFGMAMYEILEGYKGHDRLWPLKNHEVIDKIIAGERPPITVKNSDPEFVKLMKGNINMHFHILNEFQRMLVSRSRKTTHIYCHYKTTRSTVKRKTPVW